MTTLYFILGSVVALGGIVLTFFLHYWSKAQDKKNQVTAIDKQVSDEQSKINNSLSS